MEKDNQENSLNKKAIIQKINFESDIIELKMQSYQNILNKDFNKTLNSYEDYLEFLKNVFLEIFRITKDPIKIINYILFKIFISPTFSSYIRFIFYIFKLFFI